MFLKQRFGTGYHLLINKTSPRCDVTAIGDLLRKYAPKVKLQSNSDKEAVFILGQIVATHLIITMFKDLEQRSADLGIESLGVTVTSLEDVLIRVGEEHQRTATARKDEDSLIEVQGPVLKVMATTVSSEPSLAIRMWAVLAKRALCVWRQKKQPLFSWLLPPLLLTLLFSLEHVALIGSDWDVEHLGDTLFYTFPGVLRRGQGQ
ncbi:phospholipid-transporting ATPase ABCA3-like [Dermacentor silvarum]|uniref:phospholipid-transporting ATPase ABCA3-like n=1 Tax=Dermacentor silvarum TaxID=543639 RepID=UPI002101AC0F|nr:phospholipid-transporting ATPase ABCA3-like [Dermacentor silvarum]